MKLDKVNPTLLLSEPYEKTSTGAKGKNSVQKSHT